MARKGRGEADETAKEPATPAGEGATAAPVQAAPGETSTPIGPLPLFYKQPQVVTADRHGKAGLKEATSYAFARETNSVPLGADEILVAQAHFPIVFTETNPPIPVAVLGLGDARNVFVGVDGTWRSGTYIPAYIRRYPFILANGGKPGEMMLAIDEAAENFVADGGRRLFEGTVPTPLARQAAQFCQAFQTQFDLARAFGEALLAAGVLLPRRADVRRPDGKTFSLQRFRVIDEARFDALPDEPFLRWRRAGWLGLAYSHLLSMRRWQSFVAPAG
ncbi:MAG TPA: SapC family protein [Stellaceae bacterium]|nr:SapC family protein [Stellaceae bacterium]